MRSRKVSVYASILLRHNATVIGLALLPVLIMIYSIVASGHFQDAIDAWQDKFIPVHSTSPHNPWPRYLPSIAGLELAFVIISGAGLSLTRHIKTGSLFFRFRIIISLLLIFGGSIFFLIAALQASLAPSIFEDTRGAAFYPPAMILVVNILPIVVLVVNTYQVFRINSSRQPDS